MGEYNIAKMVDTPPAGYARVDAFFTAKDHTVYAILPRWPGARVEFNDLEARADAKITMLETGQTLKWRREGSRISVEMPERTEAREAYVLKIAV
jgi:alpha-L-fucosidase